MKRLDRIARKKSRIAVGLISGTSADGADGAVVRVSGSGGTLATETLHCRTVPYPGALRDRVLAAAEATTAEIALLHADLGRFFADAARMVIGEAGLAPDEVDLLGSHGQTVFHAPEQGATLQLGDGCAIAHGTGILTVSDFRAADVAAGGEGAPLVPYLDLALFGGLEGCTVALNLGGIANITIVPGTGSAGAVTGFDTGPANMVLDGLAARLLPGAPSCDKGGAAAARGKVAEGLLEALLDDAFYSKAPPKSTGREKYGALFVDALLESGAGLPAEDLLATAAALTAETIARAVRDFSPPGLFPPGRVVASGGGVHNKTILAMIGERLAPVPLLTSADFGVPVDGKEAVLFALLASETISGVPTGIPSVTGAALPRVLGKISLP